MRQKCFTTMAALTVLVSTFASTAFAKGPVSENTQAQSNAHYAFVQNRPVDVVQRYQLVREGNYRRPADEWVGSRTQFTVDIAQQTSPEEVSATATTITCAASAGIGEVAVGGNPSALSEFWLQTCTAPDVTATGYMYLERFDRSTNTWSTLKSASVTVAIGQRVTTTFQHDGAKVNSDYRTRVNLSTNCAGCVTSSIIGSSPLERFDKFFSSWTTFSEHYTKHVVTQNEWPLQRPTQMEYLDMGRTAAAYASLVASGAIWDSAYHASNQRGNLYGYDANSNDVIIVNATTATYPYIGTHYKWMAQYDPYWCPTGLDHYKRISNNSVAGTGCAR